MQKSPEEVATDSGPAAGRWQKIHSAYRIANLATHHVLGFTVKLGLLLYCAFALALLFLRYAILPNIDFYKANIEQLASQAIGNRVSIAHIDASWRGLRPNLFLGDVTLRDKDGRKVLNLPSISATLSWWSVLAAEVRFDALELIGPDLELSRTPDGWLHVAGASFDPNKGGDGKGADWILSQREIVVREARLHWTDSLHGAPPLNFDHVNLVLRNKWRGHQFALQATPPAAFAAPIDVRADFFHPRFASRISKVSMWKGAAFADLKDVDLAAWQRYIDFPFELIRGTGSVRAWLSFDHTRLANLTADVGVSDLAARLGPNLAPLELVRAGGRIVANETFLAHGHAVSLSHFSLETKDGLILPPSTLSGRHIVAANGQADKTEIKADLLDLHTLAELALRLPLSPAQRALLAECAPRGRVQDFSAEWQGAGRDVYHVKGRVAGLGVTAQPARPAQPETATLPALPARSAIPGIENLNGAFDASERGGNVSIHSSPLILHMPAYFADPALPFERLTMQARWSLMDQSQIRIQIDALNFMQQGLVGALRGSYFMPRTPGKGPGSVDFTGTLNNFDVKTIDRYLPLQTPPHLRAWLSGALEQGVARDVSLRLRGDLAQFPFKGETVLDKSRGEFRVAGRIDDGKLNYAPGHFAKDGKAPLWPQAEHIKGSFVFERARMEIRGDSAKTGTGGVSLSSVTAVIPDLTAKELLLDIDGHAQGALQAYLNYVSATPVLEWIAGFTSETLGSGNATLALKLHLPLSHLIESKVQGVLQLKNNDVTLFNDLPPVQAAAGKIEFDEKGVNLNNLGGSFLGGPLAIAGGTLRDGSIQVRIGGSVSADALRKTYPAPAMQRLASRLSGNARYAGSITARSGQVQVAIDSTLAGLELDFPAPLKKAALESLPLRFVLNGGPANDAGMMRDEISIALGSGMVARYQRQKEAHHTWRMMRGGIGVNAAAPEPDNGMMLNVMLKSLDIDAWTSLVHTLVAPSTPQSTGVTAAADAPDLLQYVLPDRMAARADELILGGRKLNNVVVGATHQLGIWQLNIDSRQASGHVQWNQTASSQGKVTARLSSLIIPESAAADIKGLLEGQSAAQTMPALDIVAEHFELFNKKIGRLELQAHNVPLAMGQEWRVSKLSLANPDGALTGSGKWIFKDGQSNTSLNFALDIADAGKLLDRLGFADTLRQGKGTLHGDIAWKGLPYMLDIPSLSGRIQMNIESGQFLKQDPGAAKLLGVLSLQALPRLLKLDFHDVFSQGLAFDGISATAAINHGVLKTDNLKMHGVAATVLMDGLADIANESSNLHVVVIPEFNLGTGPLVYALAVNPVIGIGSFLAQLFLRAPMMQALTYQMRITGPWQAPVITKLNGTGSAKLE